MYHCIFRTCYIVRRDYAAWNGRCVALDYRFGICAAWSASVSSLYVRNENPIL